MIACASLSSASLAAPADAFRAPQGIAKFIINLHMNRANETAVVGEIDIDKMKRYIAYCKSYVLARSSFFAAFPTDSPIWTGVAHPDFRLRQRRSSAVILSRSGSKCSRSSGTTTSVPRSPSPFGTSSLSPHDDHR